MGKDARSGTLMWIGSRDTVELQPIFQYCEEQVSQIAVRRDLRDARQRRADNVRCILLARHDRSIVDYAAIEKLMAQHPYARALELLGSLVNQREPGKPGIPKVPWHAWNQMSNLLSQCGVDEPTPHQAALSVAVVADSLSTAEPLMDLAVSTGAAAIWCRHPRTPAARNFDVVWWDDSVATATKETLWKQRLLQQGVSAAQTHVWMTNYPLPHHLSDAQRAGISTVLSKPLNIDRLLATIGANAKRPTAVTTNRLRAA